MHTSLAKILLGLKETLDKLLTWVPINISGRFPGHWAMGPTSVLLIFPAQHRRAHLSRAYNFRKRISEIPAHYGYEDLVSEKAGQLIWNMNTQKLESVYSISTAYPSNILPLTRF